MTNSTILGRVTSNGLGNQNQKEERRQGGWQEGGHKLYYRQICIHSTGISLCSCGMAGARSNWTWVRMVDKRLNGKNASKGDTHKCPNPRGLDTESPNSFSSIPCAGTPTLPFIQYFHSILSAIQKPLEQNSVWLIEMVKRVS